MAVKSTTVALVAATPGVLATGDQSGVQVFVLTSLADLFIGGSDAQTFPVVADFLFSTVLLAGDILYGLSATGGNVQVLRTRS
jgi:hypothetical protein